MTGISTVVPPVYPKNEEKSIDFYANVGRVINPLEGLDRDVSEC